VPHIVKRYMHRDDLNEVSRKYQNRYRIEQNRKLKTAFDNPSYQKEQIYYIDVMALQCGKGLEECEIISSKNQKFLFFDDGHFTREGAYQFGKKLKKDHPELF